MTLTGEVTQGFEFHRYTSEGEVLWVPGDPGDAIARGDALMGGTAGEGILDIAATDEESIAVAQKTVTMAAASTGFPKPKDFDPGSDTTNTLVPVKTFAPAGTPVFRVTFANHAEDTVAAYTAATPSLTLTNALGGNDYSNGALIYVYAGTGAGQVNVGADYVDTSKVLTLHRAFATALDTTSKVAVLDGAAASGGVGFFSRLELKDEDEIDVSDGADNNTGRWAVYMSWHETAHFLAKEQLLLVPAKALYNTIS